MLSSDSDASDDDDVNSIKINENYAARFEHNKRREELHRRTYSTSTAPSARIESHRRIDPRLRFVVKDKYGDAASDDDDDESVEEDDDAVLMTKPIEDRFLTLLPLLRKRHESVYQAKTPFFPCTCCCHSLESALVLDAIIDTHDTDQHCCLVCAAYKETRELANLEVTLSTHSGCVRYDLQLASF